MEHVKNIISRIFASRKARKDSGENNDGTCGNEARWTLDTATGELRISGTGRLHDFVNGKKIPWEKHQSIIRKAYIDDGITYIGFQAFAYCTALTEVRLPSSLATIGVQAFAYCKSLSAVRLPEGVGSLGDYAFSHCYGLREAVLPSSLRHIGKGAFCSCQSLQRVCLPDGITEIGSQAFADCKHLSEVELPPRLTRLKSYCFSGCSSLASLNLPPSATHIGDYAFSGCSALTSVSLPEGVTDVGVQAFADCRSLRQVAFPASLRRLAPASSPAAVPSAPCGCPSRAAAPRRPFPILVSSSAPRPTRKCGKRPKKQTMDKKSATTSHPRSQPSTYWKAAKSYRPAACPTVSACTNSICRPRSTSSASRPSPTAPD